jgi:hypothetical protein
MVSDQMLSDQRQKQRRIKNVMSDMNVKPRKARLSTKKFQK